MLRTIFIAFLTAMIGTTSFAAEQAMKKIKRLPSAHQSAECYEIDGKIGWQRVTFPAGATSQVLNIFGPHNITQQDIKAYRKAKKIGWSVGGWTQRAGPAGHSGKDAKKLKPWKVYKYLNDVEFGALIVRLPNGWTGDVINPTRANIELNDQQYYDFRINDSDEALWDNEGFLVMCFVSLEMF